MPLSTIILLVALDILGLLGIWLYVKYRLKRALEFEGLVEGLRKEIRALNIELNETAERNISLVEDRMEALKSLLDEADTRLGVMRRELENRAQETEVYTRIGRGRRLPTEPRGPEPLQKAAGGEAKARSLSPAAPQLEAEEEPKGSAREQPIRLDLGRRVAEIVTAKESVIPPKSMREEALDLYYKGFSADIIAARLGATVAEIDLLISLEERRRQSEEG